jgi:hypothetical protein
VEDANPPSAEHRGSRLIIDVPRTADRSNLRRCRARAKGDRGEDRLRTEPRDDADDGPPFTFGGPVEKPQRWIFTFSGRQERGVTSALGLIGDP